MISITRIIPIFPNACLMDVQMFSMMISSYSGYKSSLIYYTVPRVD